MILGLLLALASAVLYGAGTVLQAVGVRRTGAAARSGAVVYAVGLLLDATGFGASLVALRDLPLFVVESAIAASVAVTALLAVWFLGVRLTRREVAALVGVAAGLLALALSAREGRAVAVSPGAGWLIAAAVVPVVALGVVGWRARGGALLLAATAGLGFGGVGIAARVVRVPDPLWHLVRDPLAWSVVAYGVVSLVAYALALQRGSVTSTAAVTFTVETVVPAAVGLVWLGDGVRPGATPLAVVGFALTLVGCLLLARHADEPAAPEATTVAGVSAR